MVKDIFIPQDDIHTGAIFSICRKYRYCLWRKWDLNKPFIMFIGLNPSTANAFSDDATIRRCKSFAFNWGYGGFYMLNCFSYISTDPKKLLYDSTLIEKNNEWLKLISNKCSDVAFCWGNFSVVKNTKRDLELVNMFPNAKVLGLNKNGSPKHPLYMPNNTILIDYKTTIKL
jgi:hypothetical protein